MALPNVWERAPRVIDVTFNANRREFTLKIIVDCGQTSLGTFDPGATRTWDGTPFLPDFEGETEPAVIIAKLGIRPSFLERQQSE